LPQVHRFEDTPGFKAGAAIGALVLSFAGGAWSLVPLITRQGTPAWELLLPILPTLALMVFSIRRLLLIRGLPRSKQLDPQRIENARQGRSIGILFGVIFTIEAAAIALASIGLAQIQRPLLIPVAVIAIMGVHFLPLAKVFRIPAYAVLGLVLIGLAAGCLLIPDEATRLLVLGIASAIALWATASVVLAVHAKA
jgi:hypothetical protein